MDYYILSADGQQAGPYSLDQMRFFWANGQVNLDTLCWAEGMIDWQPIRGIEDSLRPPQSVPSKPPVFPSESTLPPVPTKPPPFVASEFVQRMNQRRGPRPSTLNKFELSVGLGIGGLILGSLLFLLIEIIQTTGRGPVSSRAPTSPTNGVTSHEDGKNALLGFLHAHPDYLPWEVQVKQEHEQATDSSGQQVPLAQGQRLRLLGYDANGFKAITDSGQVIHTSLTCTDALARGLGMVNEINTDLLVGTWSVSYNADGGSSDKPTNSSNILSVTLKDDHTYTYQFESSTIYNQPIVMSSYGDSGNIPIMMYRNTKIDDGLKYHGTWKVIPPADIAISPDLDYQELENSRWVDRIADKDNLDAFDKPQILHFAHQEEGIDNIMIRKVTLEVQVEADVYAPFAGENTKSTFVMHPEMVSLVRDAGDVSKTKADMLTALDDFDLSVQSLAVAESKDFNVVLGELNWGQYQPEALDAINHARQLLKNQREMAAPLAQRAKFFLSFQSGLLKQKVNKAQIEATTSSSQSTAQGGNPTNVTAALDKVEILDASLKPKLTFQRMSSHRAPNKLLDVSVNVHNNTGNVVLFEAETIFKDKDGTPLNKGSCIDFSLKPYDEIDYRSTSISEKAVDFTICLRSSPAPATPPAPDANANQ